MQITQILQIFHLTQKKSFNLTQISQISQKAMRHDYPHAEAQRAQSSHRDFIVPLPHSAPHPSKGRGPWQGGRGVEVTDPTPRCAHPSP
jgi:hypothetical protein